MTNDDANGTAAGSRFRSTLIRVLAVQAVALIILWAFQARYHVL